MKQNKYYTMNPPYQYREEYKDARFTSHSFRTGKTLAHYVDGHTENSTKTYDCCERLVNEGVFKRLSYKEAMAMIKNPVEDKPQYRYFTSIKGFDSEVVFIKCETFNCFKNGRSYYKNGQYEESFSLNFCLAFVKDKKWKEITKEQAEAMIEPVKKDEDELSIDEDVYSIRCFLNNEPKTIDTLTIEEAYLFRQSVARLYNYLTKKYKLAKK